MFYEYFIELFEAVLNARVLLITMTSLVLAISSILGEHSTKPQGEFSFHNEPLTLSSKEVRKSRDDIDGMLQPLSVHHPLCNYYFVLSTLLNPCNQTLAVANFHLAVAKSSQVIKIVEIQSEHIYFKDVVLFE